MKKLSSYSSILKVGATCVAVAGICYFCIAVCALFSPKPIASYVASKYYFDDFQSYGHYFILLKYLMLIGNASFIGFVVAIFYLKNRPSNGWFILLTVLSIVGLGIGMLQSITDATNIPHLAKVYDNATAIIQHVIIAFGVANTAIYMLSMGLPGIWLIFLNFSLKKEFPLLLFLSGIAWGMGFVLTVFAHLLVILPLIYLIAWGALIGVPIWTFYQTRYLYHKYKEARANNL